LSTDCFDEESERLFNDMNESLDGGLLNLILVFFVIFFIVEPNMAYFLKKCFGKCCKGCELKDKKKDKKYKNKKRKGSNSSSDFDDYKKNKN